MPPMRKKTTKAAPAKRGRGRPKTNGNSRPITVKVGPAFEAATEAYRKRHGLDNPSAAVRRAAEETYEREGLLLVEK